jgi:glycosyltransferase involved in cell wall biosynthesis
MRILWIKTDFLHPATKGGHIRTLEILRRLHRRHEIHYVGFDDPARPEGVPRSVEYCTRAYPLMHSLTEKDSLWFLGELAAGLFSRTPVAVSRYRSQTMREQVRTLRDRHQFDSIVCDFLAPSVNLEDLAGCVLFQHNVETAIWRRHAEHASGAVRRLYFRLQAERMFRYERDVCRAAGKVIAVSDNDADLMGRLFEIPQPRVAPTGVDIEYFTPAGQARPAADLVFVGSMDWLPNIDGIAWFVRDVLPLIRRWRPGCSVAIVGRAPTAEVAGLADRDPLIQVTGTVPDIRPWLWDALVSVVPLRIGGGTRLKIYEAMAAKVPVVSTSVGAEGLEVSSPETIRLADTPEGFAEACLELLNDSAQRARMASAAWDLVAARLSWDQAALCFERILEE